jgi:hypothetical protein
MPKRSVYFKGEEDVLYEKVKGLTEETGETIASVFVNAMKDYIARKEQEKLGFEEIKLFVGERDSSLGDVGEEIVFTGKLIGSGTKQEDVKVSERLYRTLKKKFLMYTSRFDEVALSETTKYEIFESVEELKKAQLMPEISKALRNGNVITRKLDI